MKKINKQRKGETIGRAWRSMTTNFSIATYFGKDLLKI